MRLSNVVFSSIFALKSTLVTSCVSLGRLQALAGVLVLAVNQEYVDMDASLQLQESDEVAVIPPLSGG